MYDLGVSFTFDFLKRNWESSVIFLRNGVLFFNCKENKEAGTICFEIRIPKKKKKELLQKIPSKNYENNCIIKKKKNCLSIILNIISRNGAKGIKEN